MSRQPQKKGLGHRAHPANEGMDGNLFGGRAPALDRRTPAVPQIYQALRDLILRLALEPGAVISKDDVARAFGVSSMPVREALRKLEEDGLVVIKPQSGTYVTTIDVQWAWEAQFLRIAVEVEVIRENREHDRRRGSQGTGNDPAPPTTSSTRPTTRKPSISRTRHSTRRCTAWPGSAVFGKRSRRCAFILDRLRAMHLPIAGQMTRILSDHQMILEGLRSRDTEKTEAALRQHLSGTLSFVETFRSQHPTYF